MRTMGMTTWLLWTVTLMVLCLTTGSWAQGTGGSALGAPPDEPQVAQPAQGGVNWKGVGLGAGAVATNLVYVPAKLAYGILGAITGGAGYALTGGNKQVADAIWRSSLGGDYVLTPDMMAGKKPIHFSGPEATTPTQNAAPVASASPSGSNVTPSTLSTAASPSLPSAEISAPPATYPIDSGAGPVRENPAPMPNPNVGTNYPASSYPSYRHRTPAKSEASPLPDTSIE